jgi:phosphopantetheinyl transferase
MPENTSSSWTPNPGQTELALGEIHVWRAYLDCGEAVLRQFEATLSTDERARAARFYFPRDRNTFIATRGVLRELLGRYIKHPPADLEFDYSPRGKPFLRGQSLELPVEFNVSHSHGIALLAFAVGRRLGIDVELVRPDMANDGIADRFFPPKRLLNCVLYHRHCARKDFFYAGRVRRPISRQEAKDSSSRLKAFALRSHLDSLNGWRARIVTAGACTRSNLTRPM